MVRWPKYETPDTPPKRERLTVTQLAGYDDILTDALVDHVYFWTTIRKNRSKYNLTRGISEEDVTAILFRDVVLGRDVPKAELALLELSGLKKYVSLLRTDRERDDFRRHMRKYINIWLPDCPFEVSTTNRYTIVTHEAAITARRPIKKGETIKYLCGNKVQMTPEEESDLDITRRDFSVVMTSRKKTPSLFLGPARFANHDCKANAKLVPRGSEGMLVVSEREINVGDEITVNYGEHYFGEDNCECLCATCEAAGVGGWPGEGKREASSGSSTPEEDSETETPKSPPSAGAKRRESPTESSLTSLTSLDSHVDENVQGDPPRKKRRISVERDAAPVDIGLSEDTLLSPTAKIVKGGSPLRNVLNVEDIVVGSDSNPQPHLSLKEAGQHGKTTSEDDALLSRIRAALPGCGTSKKSAYRQSEPEVPIPNVQADALSTGEDMPYRFSSPFSFLTGRTSSNASSKRHKQFFHRSKTNHSQVKSRKPSLGTSSLSSAGRNSTFDNLFPKPPSSATTPSTNLAYAIDWNTAGKPTFWPFSSGSSSALSSPLSSLTSIAEIDDTTLTVTPKRRRKGRGRWGGGPRNNTIAQSHLSAKITKPKPTAPRTPRKICAVQPTIELEIPSHRTPGDYIRTRLLLGESHSRWVDCRTCEACWVQANGYQTRKECPRCERHSKLYGYQWPKTEKAGKYDDEERVMDHRTVHRFIPPEEEKFEIKKGRGVGRMMGEVLGLGESGGSESTGDEVGSSANERTESRSGTGRTNLTPELARNPLFSNAINKFKDLQILCLEAHPKKSVLEWSPQLPALDKRFFTALAQKASSITSLPEKVQVPLNTRRDGQNSRE
ncbi:histone lysine methyltransferase Set9 [Lecanora helva]